MARYTYKIDFRFVSNLTVHDFSDYFLFVLEKINFRLVPKQIENCHHDYIPRDLKGNVP